MNNSEAKNTFRAGFFVKLEFNAVMKVWGDALKYQSRLFGFALIRSFEVLCDL